MLKPGDQLFKDPQWYCFELSNGMYIGKCFTSKEEILKVLPYSRIEGNGVTVFAPPPKES